MNVIDIIFPLDSPKCPGVGYKALGATHTCLKANYDSKTKLDAEGECVKDDGFLVQIDSAIKHSEVSKFIQRESLPGMCRNHLTCIYEPNNQITYQINHD